MLHHSPTRSRPRAMGHCMLPKLFRRMGDTWHSHYHHASDSPIARAATLAELRGWAPIAGIQLEYSLVERTSDRELLPMAEALGLAMTAWSPLGGGLLSGKYRRGEAGRLTAWGNLIHAERGPRETAIVDAVEAVAGEAGATPAQVAVAWVRAKGLFPILGPRTPAQLEDTLGALAITLSAD